MSDEQFADRMNKGAAHYRQSHSTAALRLKQRSVGILSGALDELCGFIDAMCDDIQTLKENKKPSLGYVDPRHTVLKPLISNEEIQIKVKESIAERALHERIKDYARFCRFIEYAPPAVPPSSIFKAWMRFQGTPLSPEGNKVFDEEYHKENSCDG